MGKAKSLRQFIVKEKKRNLYFRQKKKTLIKKARDLSILCDVPICVIIFPFVEGNKNFEQPEIFSYKGGDDSTTNPELAREIINRYLALPMDVKHNKRSLNLSDVLKDVNEEKLVRKDQDLYNIKCKSTNLSDFTDEQLVILLSNLEHKLDSVTSRIAAIKSIKNHGFAADQQEIQALDVDKLMLTDFDEMFADLIEPATADYEGKYDINMMSPTPSSHTDIDQGTGFADNYSLQCIPMMYPTPTGYNDVDQGSGFADDYPLQCIPTICPTPTSYTDADQGSGFANDYPLQCIPMMGCSIYNGDLGQRFADNFPLQCDYSMTSTGYCKQESGFTDNMLLQCNPIYHNQEQGSVDDISAMQSYINMLSYAV